MSKYGQIISWVFLKNYQPGDVIVAFNRNELVSASEKLGFARIKNLGDIPYSFRFRRELPEDIQSIAPEGCEWIIVGTGIGEYAFRLAAPGKIAPNLGIVQVMQDIALCYERYSRAICRPIALQFSGENNVALLELAIREEDRILRLNTVEGKHYQLVQRTEISDAELELLKDRESNH